MNIVTTVTRILQQNGVRVDEASEGLVLSFRGGSKTSKEDIVLNHIVCYSGRAQEGSEGLQELMARLKEQFGAILLEHVRSSVRQWSGSAYGTFAYRGGLSAYDLKALTPLNHGFPIPHVPLAQREVYIHINQKNI